MTSKTIKYEFYSILQLLSVLIYQKKLLLIDIFTSLPITKN